jgi:hypothetical protein
MLRGFLEAKSVFRDEFVTVQNSLDDSVNGKRGLRPEELKVVVLGMYYVHSAFVLIERYDCSQESSRR